MGESYWPLRADSGPGEVFNFTWSMDSGASARPASEARGIVADRAVVDEVYKWAQLFVTGRQGGKMNYQKTAAVRVAKDYLTSAKLTADETITAVREILSALNVSAAVTPVCPKWRAGDVITVRFNGCDPTYTYVRGRNDWPGDNIRLSDAQVNAHYIAGSAKPLLQQGGVAFDPARRLAP